MKEDKHEIIIFQGTTDFNYESSQSFIEKVGEWDLVTREELNILRTMRHVGRFEIIERNPYNAEKPELRTPADYIAEYYRLEAERKVAAEARRVKRENKKKQDEKDVLKRKRAQLEKLKKELGEV